MSDPFDDLDALKSAMQAATPAPDAARKSENIALAQNNFAARQETRDHSRSTSDRPTSGLFRGVLAMIRSITPRHALTASTALVAIGLVAYLPTLQNGPPSVDDLASVADQSGWGSLDATPEPADETTPEPTVETNVLTEEVAAASADTFAEPMVMPAPKAAKRLRETSGQSLMASPAPTQTMPARKPAPMGIIADIPQQLEADTETFPDAAPNPLKITTQDPVSTFSIDVDTASYAILRSTLNRGQLPSPEQIRVEEMVNYFPYNYDAPIDTTPFSTTATVLNTPWNDNTQLVHIALQGAKPETDTRPPLNLVFLIDTSGSMHSAAKLPLLKQSFRLMLGQLRPQDQVAIVAYAGSAGQVLAPTPANERATILQALETLSAGGATAGQAGLQQAYALADTMSEKGEVSRVILATDGDFNVGIRDPEALKTYIAQKRDTGTYLSVLGFGRGNLDDATMQALAQNGNGQAAYIDTLAEAQKTLVDQLSGALFPIANDVKIQVEFNPEKIAEYRLIGYETRALNREDFNNDRIDAGEIGAGHSVTAIYEVTPVGSPARLNDPLRYQPTATTPDTQTGSAEYGFLRLRYKKPGSDTSQLIETPIVPRSDAAPDSDASFAVAIAGFGQLLRDNPYLGSWSYSDAIALANANKGADPFGYRTQAVQLMRLADSLSQ
jgi:Ca-activated chloride channel family protein